MDAPHLNTDLVRRVAHLARLGLDERELEGLALELAEVLGHFEALQSVETTDVEPLIHALDDRGEAAPDQVGDGVDPRSTILPLTVHAREGFFVVPRVLEADFGSTPGTGRHGG